MHKLKWQWICVTLLVIVGCTRADKSKFNVSPATNPAESTKANQNNPVPAPPFKFSISYQQMMEDPRKAQAIVEKELAPNPEIKKNEEMEARRSLGHGFEALGDFDSAAKNFLRCESLSKQAAAEANLVSDCLLGLARVARFSNSQSELARLYDLRNSPSITPELKIQFYAELINNFSFKRDFDKAKKLVAEVEPNFDKLSALDQYMLKYSQALMLIDAKEFDAAETPIQKARSRAKKLGPQLEAWVDHLEGIYLLSKKDFAKAKPNYIKAINIIGQKDSQFNAFWVHYQGLKLGFYLEDSALASDAQKKCAKIISGAEIEKKFSPLINAWMKLGKQEDITTDIAALNKSLGPNTNIVEELKVAKASQKSK